VFFYPKEWKGDVVIWLHKDGKAGLFQGGKPRAEVQKLVQAGKSVVGVDLLYQGEFLDGSPFDKAPKVSNSREAPAYTHGYNYSVFAKRAHDVLTVIAFVKNHERTPQSISLLALDGVPAAIAAAARVQSGDAITRAAVDPAGFRFIKIDNFLSPDLLPAAARYGDVTGLLALAAPAKTWVAGESADSLGLVARAFQAAGKADSLVIDSSANGDTKLEAAVSWLLKKEG
jgi:hypothetical protein